MAIIGFNFTKMLAERLEGKGGQLKIDNNVNIENVEESNISLGKEGGQKAIKYLFKFTAAYDPKIGNIELEGEILDLQPEEVVKASLDLWKKDKKIDPKLLEIAMAHILNKCNMQAIVMAKDMNLPSPVPLPRLKKK